MAVREQYRIRFLLIITLFSGCSSQLEKGNVMSMKYLNSNSSLLSRYHGDTYVDGKEFSGRLFSLSSGADTIYACGYSNGKQDGWAFQYYPGGKVAEERFFAEGRKEGVHKGWWEDGKPKFEYHFKNGEHHGELKEWYQSGRLARSFHYCNGHEEGLQQMWWEDGSVRANYIVKDGEQFGLTGRKRCVNANL